MQLAEDEFERLTLRQFEMLLDRKQYAEKREFLRAGIVAAAIYNANPFRGENSKTVHPIEFVPGEEKPEQTPAEQLAILKKALRK